MQSRQLFYIGHIGYARNTTLSLNKRCSNAVEKQEKKKKKIDGL